MWPNRTKVSGFTLLEMLLAMAIFALLGVATAGVLTNVLSVNETSETHHLRLKQVQRAMSLMQRDFEQMVMRPVRGEGAEPSDSNYQFGDGWIDSDADGISFYRLGWLNPRGQLPRGTLQQVGYRLQENQLQRLHHIYPDPIEGDDPQELVLLDKVVDLKFAFYVDDKWQTKLNGSPLARAVSVKMELEDFGEVERRFLLPDGVGSAQNDDSNGGNNNGGNNGGSNGGDNGDNNSGGNEEGN
ncbi:MULTISPECIES: type II secretion system minor pseudopilin GspJ [Ferrimonas]|uniref:type II secretion system minor pseudopilin GspJ n=1 Tax=Ferrimonas TaxID=44011 RepID=UPI000406B0A6|nr:MULTISPECIES: type II secretion system minor pseudopilin GspJ [Ferrimonas]USD37806.1 type II secretion system minor pseudopilin GspJ [Ferrimonas sp. SCSIO 43195]